MREMTGWYTMIDENLAAPFETKALGVPVTVEHVDLNRSETPIGSGGSGFAPAPGLLQITYRLIFRNFAA